MLVTGGDAFLIFDTPAGLDDPADAARRCAIDRVTKWEKRVTH
jgi:hypothetical protein